MEKETILADRAKLRRLAEKALEEKACDSADLSNKSPEDIAAILHELRVHQIELTVQNEELRRINIELEQTKDQYSHLYDFAPIGYFTINEKGIITEANLTFASMLDVERGSLVGGHLSHFVLEEDQDIYYKHRQRLLETALPQICDLRLVKKGGHRFYAHFECALTKNEGNNEKEIRAAVHDITERKMAEKELREKSHFLDQIIESSALSTWISDDKGIAIRANPACLEFFGATENEIIGKYNLFQDVVFERNGFMPDIQDVFAKGRTVDIVIDYDFGLVNHVNVKKGTHKIINSIFTPITDDAGKVTNAIVQTIDLTNIKRMERELNQARKMESIGNLAGGIAHDFNNILASIIGFAELALDDVPKGTLLEDSLQEVYMAAKRAMDLVKQILAFAHQSEEKRKPIRVDTIAKGVLKFIRATIPATIEIDEKIESDAWIMGNMSQMQQVFVNLCTNAAHAIEGVGGILKVWLTDVEYTDQSSTLLGLNSGTYIKISVSDNGSGISPDIIDSIFEPYFTTKGIGEGTGMGLAMVHGIVESYGGKITVESELGKGTTFSIYLPVTQERESHQQLEKERLSSGPERILFVDDEAPIAKMGSRILERLGYRVTFRTSSIEALELFRSKPDDFDLVITDMTMPKMTGDKLAMELIATRSDIPVILCTGYSKNISYEKAAKIGIKALAYKPIVKADLAKKVRKVLDESKSEIK